MNCNTETAARLPLDVFVMEVDMSRAGKSGCRSCDTTTARVNETVAQLRPIFDGLGVDVRVDKLVVTSEAQARALGLRASPMIRIGAIELAPEHRDAPRGASEGELETKRLWQWKGTSYSDPPTAMLLDALLRAYAMAAPEGAAPERAEVPPYVRQYLSADRVRASASAEACGTGCP